jgi:hypothetical protein
METYRTVYHYTLEYRNKDCIKKDFPIKITSKLKIRRTDLSSNSNIPAKNCIISERLLNDGALCMHF